MKQSSLKTKLGKQNHSDSLIIQHNSLKGTENPAILPALQLGF